MRKFVFLYFVFITLSPSSYAQLIDNRLDIGASVGISTNLSGKISDSQFSDHSFYQNLKTGTGFTVFMDYQLMGQIGVGLRYFGANFNSWKNPVTGNIDQHTLKTTGISLLATVSTPFSRLGLWNKFKASIGVGPVFTSSKFHLGSDIYFVEDLESGSLTPLHIDGNYSAIGVQSELNAMYKLSHNAGLKFTVNLSYYDSSAADLLDDNYLQLNGQLGVFLRLFHDKRYVLR